MKRNNSKCVFYVIYRIKQRTPGRAIFMIAAVWIMSALICIPPLLGWKGKKPEGDLPQCQVSRRFFIIILNTSQKKLFNIPSREFNVRLI